MLGKDELIKLLKEINEKRLLSHEVTTLLGPFKEATFPLSLEFISHSRTFGKQKDLTYDGGQTGIFKIEGLDTECAVLFGPEDNEMIEKKKVGDRSEILVCYFDYDSLYRRIIFGKVSPSTDHDKGGSEKGADLARDSAAKTESQGITESISSGPEIEVPQRSNDVIKENQIPVRGSSAKFKRKKKRLSFPMARKNGPGRRSAKDSDDYTYNEEAKTEFRNLIGPILICGGIIFCLKSCSESFGLGIFIGVLLLMKGILVRFSNKEE